MKLGEFITLQRGYDLPESERRLGNIPVVSSSGIFFYHDTVGARGPGVVTGRYGTIGKVFFVKEDYWPLNTTLFVKDFHGNDPLFVSYFLKTLDFTSCSDKSSVPGVNRNDLHNLPITVPPLPTQHAIARILGSLDDKIELNRQMNETLEAMARAIFQSWFVDFDPVRAKAEGKPPAGMDAETAALFPSEIVEVDGREVPKGWGVGTISDLGDITSGQRPENRESIPTIEKPIPLYGGGGVMGYVATPLFQQSILITGRVGTLGEIFRITSPCWASDNTLIIIPNMSEFYEYLYYQLRSFDFDSLNRGSTQPLVTQNDLKAQEIIIPVQQILKQYHKIVKPLFEKIDKNDEQSRTLAQIRDALLPKLMSGEIQVPAET